MANSILGVNGYSVESLISSMRKLSSGFATSSFDKLLNYDQSLIKKEDDIQSKLESIKSQIKSLKIQITNTLNSIESAYDKVKEVEEKVQTSTGEDLPDSPDIETSSSSGYTGYHSGSSTGFTSSKGKSSIEKSVNSLSVDDLLIEILAPYGVTKENFESVTKNSKDGYVVSIKNTNEDGIWNANDIKEYRIKDGNLASVLTGDGTVVEVVDGKLVIDESNSTAISGAIVTGVSTAGGYFASKTTYNTKENKEIFKKFYPNASDEEFDVFCDELSKNGKCYNEIAESVIEANNDNITDLTEKISTNSLVIEENKIKVDSKSIATELYAYELSKNGVDFSDGISSELVFNEEIATDLVEYLKTNYSIDIDISTIIGSDSELDVAMSTSSKI